MLQRIKGHEHLTGAAGGKRSFAVLDDPNYTGQLASWHRAVQEGTDSSEGFGKGWVVLGTPLTGIGWWMP